VSLSKGEVKGTGAPKINRFRRPIFLRHAGKADDAIVSPNPPSCACVAREHQQDVSLGSVLGGEKCEPTKHQDTERKVKKESCGAGKIRIRASVRTSKRGGATSRTSRQEERRKDRTPKESTRTGDAKCGQGENTNTVFSGYGMDQSDEPDGEMDRKER